MFKSLTTIITTRIIKPMSIKAHTAHSNHKKGKIRFALLSCMALPIFLNAAPASAIPWSSPASYLPQTASYMQSVTNSQLQGAQDFVQDLAETGIAFLSNPDLSQSGKTKQFKVLLERNFDLEKIGRYALGRYWRVATDKQKKEYQKLFKDMILNVYSDRFKEYKNQDVDIVSSNQKGKNILVSSVIKDPEGPDIKLDWVVRQNNGGYKVIDVLVEGVSMVITQRSDFASVIQKNGGEVQALIDMMKNNKYDAIDPAEAE